jgi:hypothetical protein
MDHNNNDIIIKPEGDDIIVKTSNYIVNSNFKMINDNCILYLTLVNKPYTWQEEIDDLRNLSYTYLVALDYNTKKEDYNTICFINNTGDEISNIPYDIVLHPSIDSKDFVYADTTLNYVKLHEGKAEEIPFRTKERYKKIIWDELDDNNLITVKYDNSFEFINLTDPVETNNYKLDQRKILDCVIAGDTSHTQILYFSTEQKTLVSYDCRE